MTRSKTSFPKKEHLRDPGEFRTIVRSAHFVREVGVALYFLERADAQAARLGIVTSRKVFKRAVDRNRAKRLVREFFRLNKENVKPKLDLVVYFRGACKLFYGNDLDNILNRLFERAGAWVSTKGKEKI